MVLVHLILQCVAWQEDDPFEIICVTARASIGESRLTNMYASTYVICVMENST